MVRNMSVIVLKACDESQRLIVGHACFILTALKVSKVRLDLRIPAL